MKNVQIIPQIAVLVLFVLMSSCNNFVDNVEDFNAFESQVSALAKTWNTDQVIFNGLDATNEENFANFTITFNENNTWTAQNGSPIFLTSGTWNFIDGDLERIDMDGLSVWLGFSLDEKESRVLTLTFQAAGSAIGARTNGLSGEYIFRLSTLE